MAKKLFECRITMAGRPKAATIVKFVEADDHESALRKALNEWESEPGFLPPASETTMYVYECDPVTRQQFGTMPIFRALRWEPSNRPQTSPWNIEG